MLNVVAPAIGTKILAKIGGKWGEQKNVTVIINFHEACFAGMEVDHFFFIENGSRNVAIF